MGGNINPISAAPRDPAIFRKSVKLGISVATKVTSTIIIALAVIRLHLAFPLLKISFYSIISNAASIIIG